MIEGLVLLDMTSVIALLFVVLIGLPHGAFDGAIANYLDAGRSFATATKFIASYCAVAGLVIAIWIVFPAVTLTLFLMISMIHFGRGDASAKSGPVFMIQVLLHGGLPIFGIIYFQQSSVIPLFDALTNGASNLAILVSKIMVPMMEFMAGLYGLIAFRDASLRSRFAEFILLAVAFAILPPLVSFALYFCIIHTGRHMRRIWHVLASTSSPKGLYRQAAGFTLTSWLVGGAAFLWLETGNLDAALLQVVFIGLAALTVPHMILVDVFFVKRQRHETK
ncbi:Brp/Blh family beta-carotene 15,15'-dioxygenase [Alphaproteobacteria bacterium]|nr:Brp/Blh family beta-carotene 15,15'-dioxygenase [Alphaproteobacteria bacterium]